MLWGRKRMRVWCDGVLARNKDISYVKTPECARAGLFFF